MSDQFQAQKDSIIGQAVAQERAVIIGAEGISKSRTVAQLMFQKTATGNGIVIFAFKSYELASEQRRNWVKMLNCKPWEIIICGSTKEHQELLTDPSSPFRVPATARFVFLVQAGVQRLQHSRRLGIESGADGTRRTILHLVVDEFEYATALVPRIAYILMHLLTGSKTINRRVGDVFTYIRDAFSEEDAVQSSRDPDDSYSVAHWIRSASFPILFLTSEQLAVKFLELIGFDSYKLPHRDFYDQTVHIWSSPAITTHFYDKMNGMNYWSEVGFQHIISDSIKKFYESPDAPSVTFTAIPHISARGSNAFIGYDILTVVANINKVGINELESAFRSLGGNMPREELEAMFYLDRLRQSIGRVVGWRGIYGNQNQCWLWVHSSIWDKIQCIIKQNPQFLPFTINEYTPNLPFLPGVLSYVAQRKTEVRNEQSQKRQGSGVTILNSLDTVFVPSPTAEMTYEQVYDAMESANIIGIRGRQLQVARVARHFGLTPSFRYIGGRESRRKVRIVKGITLKNPTPSTNNN